MARPKVWSAIETYGTARLGAAITDNCRMAALMGGLAGQTPMRLMAPVVSNLCVFTATVNGITCLRAAITNRRTRKDDVIAAMTAVRDLAL